MSQTRAEERVASEEAKEQEGHVQKQAGKSRQKEEDGVQIQEEDVAQSRPIIHSHGGGTQSTALSVLYATGRLPKPALVVIADTGREATETWEYMENYTRPMLEEVGIEVAIASHDLATVDLYGGKDGGDLLVPAFTQKGKMPTFCSNEWKKRVVGRYLRSRGYGPKNPVTEWIGISLDEIGRAKPSGVKWREYGWPLIFQARVSRADCKRIVQEAGLPEPPKSSCWMCPHRRNSQWRHLRDNHPEDWQKAIAFDEEIRANDKRGGVFVHMSKKPLAKADIDNEPDRGLSLFGELEDGCDSGYCMV